MLHLHAILTAKVVSDARYEVMQRQTPKRCSWCNSDVPSPSFHGFWECSCFFRKPDRQSLSPRCSNGWVGLKRLREMCCAGFFDFTSYDMVESESASLRGGILRLRVLPMRSRERRFHEPRSQFRSSSAKNNQFRENSPGLF